MARMPIRGAYAHDLMIRRHIFVCARCATTEHPPGKVRAHTLPSARDGTEPLRPSCPRPRLSSGAPLRGGAPTPRPAPPFDSVAAIVVCRRVECGVCAGVRCGVAALYECRPWLATARGCLCAPRCERAVHAVCPWAYPLPQMASLSSCGVTPRARVCVSPWWPPPNCAPTAVLRQRGPRVGRPRVIDVDLARRRRRPRPPARRTAGHAAGGREVCDPRGAHGASGQRCVRAHGLRCRCGCGAVRECVGRVCVCGASPVPPSCGFCSAARKLVRSDLCRVWSPPFTAGCPVPAVA